MKAKGSGNKFTFLKCLVLLGMDGLYLDTALIRLLPLKSVYIYMYIHT